ncbi:MAG: hypothetical protein EOO10_21945 [Chitinophagaceae bacterium]|nr:MAG: hypothetical protein EOO10_21945 [Chitinophagaceae bacterium]
MKNSLLPAKWFAFVLVVSFSLLACKKQEAERVQRRAFKAQTDTWYRISPTTPTALTIGGNLYFTFAHVPGGGEGNATHMGKIKTYFNQLAYTSNLKVPAPAPEGSITAAVVDVINYPIINFPLPFIQANDFSGLVAAKNALNIPQTINGKIVSSFLYNDKGDAVFISNSSASVITPTSPNRNDFSGKALIVGGRGQFINAFGEVDFAGWFDPTSPNNAEYNVDGWISY